MVLPLQYVATAVVSYTCLVSSEQMSVAYGDAGESVSQSAMAHLDEVSELLGAPSRLMDACFDYVASMVDVPDKSKRQP